jgi:hypothetical protein
MYSQFPSSAPLSAASNGAPALLEEHPIDDAQERTTTKPSRQGRTVVLFFTVLLLR